MIVKRRSGLYSAQQNIPVRSRYVQGRRITGLRDLLSFSSKSHTVVHVVHVVINYRLVQGVIDIITSRSETSAVYALLEPNRSIT